MFDPMADDPKPTPDEQVLSEGEETLFSEDGVAQAEDTAVVESFIQPDEAPAEPIIEKPKRKEMPAVPVWKRLRRWFLPNRDDVLLRLDELTDAIAMSPEAVSNYVLRGELYLELREGELAEADFQRGYELAEAQFEAADWGLMEQVMRDRALAGLQRVGRR
jgi:hypothetical protein